jgi:hypothetical protein
MTTIIAADFMYLVILGNDNIVQKIIDKLNYNICIRNKLRSSDKMNKYKYVNQIYLKCNIDIPCASLLDDPGVQNIVLEDAKQKVTKQNKNIPISDSDIDDQKKYIILDEGIETAQCLTYADISSNYFSAKVSNMTNMMMVMLLNEHDTHFKLSYPILQLDEEENPDRLISDWLKKNKLDNIVKELTIRPVNIVGNEHEILVFLAFINS